MSVSCREHARLIGTLLDGELDAVKMLDVEEHIAACEPCRERVALEQAMRASLKRVVRGAVRGSSQGFQERMRAAMVAEAMRVESETAAAAVATLAPESSRPLERERGKRGLLHWRTLMPVAGAAALVFAWGTLSQGPGPRASAGPVHAGFAGNEALADLLAEHSRPLPPDSTSVKDVRALERYVGVPVRPPTFRSPSARFVGGRVFNLHRERAAMLQYQVGEGSKSQRVSVFIYDPQKIQITGDGLSPRTVGTSEVQVGRSEGHSVAVMQRAGVGYTVASDLEPEASAQLVAFTDED